MVKAGNLLASRLGWTFSCFAILMQLTMILPAIPAHLTVVVSRGQSRHPDKRQLEADVVAAAEAIEGVRVLDVPHLYDLKADSEAIAALAEVDGDLLIASWLFPRATHWLLDRLNIRGQFGETSLDDAAAEEDEAAEDGESRVTDLFPRSGRTIYSIDMRGADAAKITAEIRRLAEQAARSQAGDREVAAPAGGGDGPWSAQAAEPIRFETASTRRWYPVIDYSRCTNCMECIDFCLFGVYGIDGAETILVEQPDNCRKGCPACSRVCPAGAIIFPQHKAPAIAGAPVEGDEGFKIDLSQLFGAPDKTADPVAIAARERDEQLLLAGREAVGLPESRRRSKSRSSQPDQLDELIDQLDAADI